MSRDKKATKKKQIEVTSPERASATTGNLGDRLVANTTRGNEGTCCAAKRSCGTRQAKMRV